MLVELHIEPNPNVAEAESRTFFGRGESHRIDRLAYLADNRPPLLVEITGWSDGKPAPAYCLLVEDSGDGLAWLIYGGNQGIRLRPGGVRTRQFALSAADEWGETWLYYPYGVYETAIAPYIRQGSNGVSAAN